MPSLACDGCGQSASSEHIARRLQRLEWTTRFRPVHIGTLLLGGVSPRADEDFLYAGRFQGEAGQLLDAAGISPKGKSPEAVLSEFQRGGFFLAYVLECPLEQSQAEISALESVLSRHLSQTIVRIRRSLRPKRVVLISELPASIAASLPTAELGCPVLLDGGKPFDLPLDVDPQIGKSLRGLLAGEIASK
jgi:hypothetical protein